MIERDGAERLANARARRKEVVALVRRLFNADKRPEMDAPKIEVDDDAILSGGTNPGIWVQAWIWVPKEQLGALSVEPTAKPRGTDVEPS